ncbi:hypothetical protein [Nocardia sp. BMG111209]
MSVLLSVVPVGFPYSTTLWVRASTFRPAASRPGA